MTHEKFSQAQHDLLKILVSNDFSIALEALEELRISGTVSDLPVLIEALHRTNEVEVKSKIASILGNLKEKESVAYLVEAINDPQYKPELKVLVSSCWENGLDFSKHLPLFIDVLIQSEFTIAFEAYTVILNLATRINQTVIDAETDKLGNAILEAESQKKELMLDVIDFLPSIGI